MKKKKNENSLSCATVLHRTLNLFILSCSVLQMYLCTKILIVLSH